MQIKRLRSAVRPLTRPPWSWVAILLVTWLAVALVSWVPALKPVQPAVMFWFLLIGPGLPYVRLLPLRKRLDPWVLALGLSLALDAVVAIGMVFAGVWSPPAGLLILMGMSMFGAGLGLALAVWPRRAATRPNWRREIVVRSGSVPTPVEDTQPSAASVHRGS